MLFSDYIQLLMIGRTIRAKMLTETQKRKNEKAPKSLKNQMFIFGLHSTSDVRPSNASKICWPKCKKRKKWKGPLSHWKIKCSFLDYVQLLMIGQAIRAKNVDWKCKKMKKAPKSSKNKLFIFGLHSTSEIGRAMRAKYVDQNAKKWKRPLSHQKIKCLFLDYIQLLMISPTIREKMLTETQKNEKGPLSHRK